MGSTVSSTKLERYAVGVAAELRKANKRGPKSRTFYIGQLERAIRRELDALDAGKEPFALTPQ